SLIPGKPPPALDMITAVCPSGPTSSTSMSVGLPWVRSFSLTVTLVTAPGIPATTIFEGYGVAGALSLIAIAVGFVKVIPPPAQGVGVGVGVGEVAVVEAENENTPLAGGLWVLNFHEPG